MNLRRKVKTHGFAAAAMLLFAGCSALQGTTMRVTVDSTVPGARITINGAPAGPAPATATVARNKPLTVMAQKEGYEAAVVKVPYRLSNTGFADAVGAALCLCPGVGLLTPGAWTLESDYVLIPLVPLPLTGSDEAPAP